MRTWMIETPMDRPPLHWINVEMPDYLPVTIYVDTTRQFSEQEIEEFMNSPSLFSEMMEIPVPKDLLFQWWCETWNYGETLKNPEAIKFGLSMETAKEDFWTWFHEESTADDTDTLYDWLCKHNYFWKRLK